MKIAFIQTGGTIDKIYPKILNSYAFEMGTPAFYRILRRVEINFQIETKCLFTIDSTDMSDEHRNLIKTTCQEFDCDKIIITHGTDAMTKTAKVLSTIKDKTVVLVGAIMPESVKGSDADFNLGVAVGAVNLLPHGVYIAMSGRVYKWDECVKNAECKFVEKK